ncbi:MAG: gamma carbonic anhydrase family protein [Leptospiraceae bacterium]|nr:gamma carbonic anhydrase family protein [Leptospiraceae bacterium]MCK6380930.1 gamma carbonic anhydrase family protein [Leptospiraceae bacterium]NUM40014.1 gamma carbonic anhydrase family protein [Leptospiraceae bacterium]
MQDDCSIWPGAVLRADTNFIKLGKAVNIQDNSTIHVDSTYSTSIGDYSLIGHNVVIHSSTIGKACLIGIGSIILENCVIGDGAMISAGCLIRGNTKIPPKAMVIQKNGELKIYENKSRPQLIIASSLEYVESSKRFLNKFFAPFSENETKEFFMKAGSILKELKL